MYKTLVCLEMRLLSTLSSLKEVLDLSWSFPDPGELPIACTVLWACFAMAVMIPQQCRWAFRGVSLNHIELASPS